MPSRTPLLSEMRGIRQRRSSIVHQCVIPVHIRHAPFPSVSTPRSLTGSSRSYTFQAVSPVREVDLGNIPRQITLLLSHQLWIKVATKLMRPLVRGVGTPDRYVRTFPYGFLTCHRSPRRPAHIAMDAYSTAMLLEYGLAYVCSELCGLALAQDMSTPSRDHLRVSQFLFRYSCRFHCLTRLQQHLAI